MISKSSRPFRRGVSLVEMMVLIGLTSMTLMLMSLLTHSILKTSREVVASSQVRQVHARLVEQLNRDAQLGDFHLSETPEKNLLWQYTLHDGARIEYRLLGRTIDRSAVSNSGTVDHKEQFRLPPTYQFASEPLQDLQSLRQIQIQHIGPIQADGNPKLLPTGLRLIVATKPNTGSGESP